MIKSGFENFTQTRAQSIPFPDEPFPSDPWVILGFSGIQSGPLGIDAMVVPDSITSSDFTMRVQAFNNGINGATIQWIAHTTVDRVDLLRSGEQGCPPMVANSTLTFTISHGLGSQPAGVVVALSQINAPAGPINYQLSVAGRPQRNRFMLSLAHGGGPPSGLVSAHAMWLAHDHTAGAPG